MKQSVHIQSLKKSDAHQIAKLANNKKIWDNLRDYIPYPYQLQDALEFITTAVKENPTFTFGISFEGQLCGIIGLMAKKDVHRLCGEIGYWIGEPFWGKGIGTKAIHLMTDYGFQELKLERIYANVFDFNVASMRILEKNGFQKEGVLRNAVIKNGKILDEHLYAKLKDE